MPVKTVKYIYSGDTDKARMFKGIGLQSINILDTSMRLGGLDQSKLKREFSDGTTVEVSNCFGNIAVHITSPGKVIAEEEVAVNLIEEDDVLIYMGNNNDLSEYSVDDIVKESIRHWRVIPSKILDLSNKKLLVIPCPKRILTDNELTAIKSFLKSPICRLFIFPGTSITYVNLILKQLESCLELVLIHGADTTTVRRCYGILPSNKIVALPATLLAWIGVNESDSCIPVVKDINGFGTWYEGICSLSYLNYYSAPDENTVWMFGQEILDKLDASSDHKVYWTTDPDYVSPYYPYTWAEFTTEVDYIAWYNTYVAKGIAPMTKSAPVGYTPTRDSNGWFNFANLGEFNFVGSMIAFVPEEKIIVTGFVPKWLTTSYDKSLSTSDMFCAWLTYGNLICTDNYKQTYFMLPWAAVPSVDYEGWGFSLPIQQ